MLKYSKNYSNHITTYFSLILILSLIISIQSKKPIMVIEGDQLDFVIKNASITNTKLFLIFYVPHCLYCKHALKVLNENLKNNFDEKDPISFGIINLENQTNIWTGLRFNITRIPYIILIENNKMYYYQNSFEEKLVMNFINEEKNIEDGLDIPPPVGFMGKLKAAMKELNEKVEIYLGNYGITKEYSSKICYVIIILGFISLFFIEYQIIEFCKSLFRRKNKKNKNNAKTKTPGETKEKEEEKNTKKEKKEKKE